MRRNRLCRKLWDFSGFRHDHIQGVWGGGWLIWSLLLVTCIHRLKRMQNTCNPIDYRDLYPGAPPLAHTCKLL
jgi:hypothetical protein